MLTLSKTALASASFAALLSLAACGGGGGGGGSTTVAPKDSSIPVFDPNISSNIVPGIPSVDYPANLIFAVVLSSMYTLTSPNACAELDPYCRLVAGKDAIVDVEVDSSVTTFRLQITPAEAAVLLPSTVQADCSEACWNDARTKPNAALHIPGTRQARKDKNVFRVRVPAHLNVPSLFWAASFDGPVATKDGPVSKSYIPKPVSRAYFKGDPIQLVVSPLRINGVLPANFPNIFQIANNVGVKIPLPVSTIRIGAAVDIPNITVMQTADDFNAVLRSFTQQVNAGSGKTYWFGMFSESVRKASYAGFGFQPGNSAIGWDNPTQWYRTMTHEVGHNLGLPHSPCGNPGTVDPNYPYANGDLYAPYPATFHYPFDLNQGMEQVQENKDVMGYCGGNYFSDYSISNIWKFMKPTAAALAYDETDRTQSASPTIQARVLQVANKVHSLDALHKRWDTNPPKPAQGPSGKGHVFSWKSGMSNSLGVRQLTTIAEKALPGIPVEVQHANGVWYTGVAYRTSEESSIDIWTPADGAPIAIRVPNMQK